MAPCIRVKDEMSEKFKVEPCVQHPWVREYPGVLFYFIEKRALGETVTG